MGTAGGCNGKYMIESRYGLGGRSRDVELSDAVFSKKGVALVSCPALNR
jgi:hypothetical protein